MTGLGKGGAGEGEECVFRVVRVCGTVVKAEEEVVRRAKEQIRRAKGHDEVGLMMGFMGEKGDRGEQDIGSAGLFAGEGADSAGEDRSQEGNSEDGSDEEEEDEDEAVGRNAT